MRPDDRGVWDQIDGARDGAGVDTVEVTITTNPSDAQTLVGASQAFFAGVLTGFPNAVHGTAEIETVPDARDEQKVAALICRFATTPTPEAHDA